MMKLGEEMGVEVGTICSRESDTQHTEEIVLN